jgi:hypothetical protein
MVFGTLEHTMVPPLNRIRGQLGLAPVGGVDDPFGRVPLLLYLTAEPFEYPRSDWPDNVVLVGPCDWDPPVDPPVWLDKIERPIVLVTTSSVFQDDHCLVQVVLQALAEEPVAVVATLPAGDPAVVRVPADTRVERFIPHGPVLDRAACAVTHGGMGATQKALAHGVPVCAVSFGRDQLEVARRVEVAGAGTRLPARRLRPDRLRQGPRSDPAARGCQPDPGGIRRREWIVCRRRRVRDPPAQQAATAEATVLTGPGILSRLPGSAPRTQPYLPERSTPRPIRH